MADNANSATRKSTKPNKTNNNSHVLRKRPVEKPERGENIIYVNSNSNVTALLTRCQKLVCNDHKEIIIYCLGAAVQRGILLALQVNEQYSSYEINASTFTNEITDDLEPATDDVDYEVQNRQNSALKIVLKQAA